MTMPYLVPPEIQEADFWMSSKANPADGPSRGAGPPAAEVPLLWAAAFLDGAVAALDARMGLCAIDTEDHSPPVSDTSGEAKNPGPRSRSYPARPRVCLDEKAKGEPPTRQRRDRYFSQFDEWLLERTGRGCADIAPVPRDIDRELASYAQTLYDRGESQ